MTKILIAGTFDIIHPGHLDLFRQAKSLGDYLIAVVARDENVIRNKGQKPFFDEIQRVKNLTEIKLIDQVILGDIKDPYKVIREHNPAIVALGYDQHAFVSGLSNLKINSDLAFKVSRLDPYQENYFKSNNIRKVLESAQSGCLLINKETNWTSHDVVAKLRSILKIKKIGHAGTLDPLATGLLICAVNKATTLLGWFNLLPKEYLATIKFGETSDSYDRLGAISVTDDNSTLTREGIEAALNTFLGKQKQLPPMFSAKKVNGQKLYKLARQGKEIERTPADIEFYDFKIIDYTKPFLKVAVKCSAGTYIRSLAHDLGAKLGTGALLWELERTAIGDFTVEQSCKLEALMQPNAQVNLIPPEEIIRKINHAYLKLHKLVASDLPKL